MTTAPPPPRPRLPAAVQGLATLFAERRVLQLAHRRYGDIFSLDVWPFEPLTVVADPDEVLRIFRGDSDLLRAGEGNSILEPIVGPRSLFLLDGDAHLRRRKFVLPPFHGEAMRRVGDGVEAIARKEIDKWPTGQPIRLHERMQVITLRVILRAVFGIEDAGRLAGLERSVVAMLNAVALPLMLPPLRHSRPGPWARFLAARAATDEVLLEEIGRRRELADVGERGDVLSLLLQATYEDGSSMSDEDLRDELVTVLVAGYETTATALSWACERVARHPGVLARLHAELDEGEDGYLECVLKETLRTRPVVTLVLRRLASPMQVGDYMVPAGATLGTSVTLVHGSADAFPAPDAFQPERFEQGAPSTYTWVPFGGGVRRCIGAAFAIHEMKTVLRVLLEGHDLSAVGKRPERARRRMITFIPSQGARVILEPRRSSSAAAVAGGS